MVLVSADRQRGFWFLVPGLSDVREWDTVGLWSSREPFGNQVLFNLSPSRGQARSLEPRPIVVKEKGF